jgi:ribosomal protein S18 acetylase RimI-like enzyme
MASATSIEILDLRHFPAPRLRSMLEKEADLWGQRLHWDYRYSSRLLMQYLDNRMLPGYAALEADRVVGFAFCVYEETKAVIGDVFALPGPVPGSDLEVEATLLNHLLETLLNSPQLERIETQLLLHPTGRHGSLFRKAGFTIFKRLFMVQSQLALAAAPVGPLPAELELRPWRDEDMGAAARLIAEAYTSHPDSLINDQYRSPHGSMRFLNNIVRYSGCGVFCPPVSSVLIDRQSRELVAMVLGSRVSAESGHITQLCVHPSQRRRGLARRLLSIAAREFARQGVQEISLTVTQANTDAVLLYLDEGYIVTHSFDAAVWLRPARA